MPVPEETLLLLPKSFLPQHPFPDESPIRAREQQTESWVNSANTEIFCPEGQESG